MLYRAQTKTVSITHVLLIQYQKETFYYGTSKLEKLQLVHTSGKRKVSLLDSVTLQCHF